MERGSDPIKFVTARISITSKLLNATFTIELGRLLRAFCRDFHQASFHLRGPDCAHIVQQLGLINCEPRATGLNILAFFEFPLIIYFIRFAADRVEQTPPVILFRYTAIRVRPPVRLVRRNLIIETRLPLRLLFKIPSILNRFAFDKAVA